MRLQDGTTMHFEQCLSRHWVDGHDIACSDNKGHTGPCSAYINVPGGRRLVVWNQDRERGEDRD